MKRIGNALLFKKGYEEAQKEFLKLIDKNEGICTNCQLSKVLKEKLKEKP